MHTLDDNLLIRLLDDDAALGDLTTEALGIGRHPGRFEFRARQSMHVSGVEEALRMCHLSEIHTESSTQSGNVLAPNQLILTGEGTAEVLHRVWKAAQILIEWSSGISSLTAEIVSAAKGVPVACTRKNAPGTKALSIRAVRAGGASMHRLGLSETLLVFPEHRLFLDEPLEATVTRLRSREPEKKIVVEVADLATAIEWANAGADVLQLEKFSPEAVLACRNALQKTQHRPLLAAAGGINTANAAAYADAGADLLVTSAPFSAPPRDVAVRFVAC